MEGAMVFINKEKPTEEMLIDPPQKKLIFVITKCKKLKNWSKEEDDLLNRIAKKHGFRNWNEIAKHISGRTPLQCASRYKRIKPGIVKGSWTKEEDELLKKLVAKHQHNWCVISRYMSSRNGKQIRDRYLNVLDPNVIKAKFLPDEDEKIVNLYLIFGSSWSKISKFVPGRTPDLIKNRFYATLRKHIHGKDHKQSLLRRKTNRYNMCNKTKVKQDLEMKSDANNVIENQRILSKFENIEPSKIESCFIPGNATTTSSVTPNATLNNFNLLGSKNSSYINNNNINNNYTNQQQYVQSLLPCMMNNSNNIYNNNFTNIFSNVNSSYFGNQHV